MLHATWVDAYTPIMGAVVALAEAERRFRPSSLRTWFVTALYKALGLHMAELIATIDDTVVGYAGYSLESDGHIVVWMLYVAPDVQGIGIGTRLLDGIEARAPEAKTMRLEVLQANTRAIAWYRRQGFDIFHEQPQAFSGTPLPVFYMDRPGPKFRQPAMRNGSEPDATLKAAPHITS